MSGTQSKAVEPKAVDPSMINPLIEHDYRDTIAQVNGVLAFLVGWAEGATEGEDQFTNTGSTLGFAKILQCCQAALDYHALRDAYGHAEHDGGEV